MKDELISIKVGSEFTLKKKRFKGDGAVFENFGNGMWVQVIYLSNITPKEKKAIGSGHCNFRFIKNENYLLPIVCYSDKLIFEMEFDPTLYQQNGEEHIDLYSMSKSNALSVILVDSDTNIVQTIRTLSIPMNLFSIMMRCYSNSYLESQFSQHYKKWINNLRFFSLNGLWIRAEKL